MTGATVDDFTQTPKESKRRPVAKKPARKPPTDKQLREAVDQTWVMLSIYVGTVRSDAYCAGVIAERGPTLTTQLLELAGQNTAVRRALEAYATTGAWGGVIGAALSMVLPIAAHHDRLPAGIADAIRQQSGIPDDGPGDEPGQSAGSPDAVSNGGMVGPYGPMGMEAGRTRNVDRPDRMREDDVSGRNSGAA